MFEAVGHDVLKLKREKFDFLNLEGLKSGEYRKLNIKEVKNYIMMQIKIQNSKIILNLFYSSLIA